MCVVLRVASSSDRLLATMCERFEMAMIGRLSVTSLVHDRLARPEKIHQPPRVLLLQHTTIVGRPVLLEQRPHWNPSRSSAPAKTT